LEGRDSQDRQGFGGLPCHSNALSEAKKSPHGRQRAFSAHSNPFHLLERAKPVRQRAFSAHSNLFQTLKRIDRRIHIRALIIKACEPSIQTESLTGYTFLCAKAGCGTMVATLNRHYLLNNGRGWLFGNLLWLSRKPIAGTRISYDLTNPRSAPSCIDSS